MNTIQKAIDKALKAVGSKAFGLHDLLPDRKMPRKEYQAAKGYLQTLVKQGVLHEKGHKYRLSRQAYTRGEIIRAKIEAVHATFGFAQEVDGKRRFFLPGREMRGALPGDVVLLQPLKSARSDDEARVLSIEEEADFCFAGEVVRDGKALCVLPDRQLKMTLPLKRNPALSLKEGDKILARAIRHGHSHFDLTAEAVNVFGKAQNAAVCAEALIAESGVPTAFTPDVLAQADKLAAQGIGKKELVGRLDLREEKIFTIDSADSKDLDDAISIKKTLTGWELGVHIADVSHYVKSGTPLDVSALERGTSIYYADRVIPMLPKALSNGICSLNPGEDRLTFSALISLDRQGTIKKYRFEKSVIRSVVKGVYSEINALLNNTADSAVKEKYKPLSKQIRLMHTLSQTLICNRKARGCPDLSSTESKFVFEDGVITDILPRTQGESERMIEEFMLLANQCAATLAFTKALPFVYRIHELPDVQKLHDLSDILRRLGLPTHDIAEKVSPARLSKVLESARETQFSLPVNNLTLRSMAKARYSETDKGHFGLALKHYAHFTSPIRRYPDLAIHRILTTFLDGGNVKKFTGFAQHAADRSSLTEQVAVRLERDCEDCYKAEFMKDKIGNRYRGIICSIAPQGLYVELPNTIQGLVATSALPGGPYQSDGVSYQSATTGKRFVVGDEMVVEVTAADISHGTVDFLPIFE